MAWMVFNPMYEEFPAEVGSYYAPHSGNQMLLSVCVSEGDPVANTDHWLISPELMGNKQEISFFARVITGNYGYEVFEVLYSTTTDAIDSFIPLEEVWTDAITWTEHTFTLPEGTKHFAIRHTAQEIFGLMLDDITFERGQSAPVGYNVYVDGELVGSTPETTYYVPSTGLSDGEHTFAVTAVYEGGKESAPARAVIDITSGINEITLDSQPVDVYTIDGRLVRRQATSLEGLNGIYLVGNKKVFIK